MDYGVSAQRPLIVIQKEGTYLEYILRANTMKQDNYEMEVRRFALKYNLEQGLALSC